MRLLLICCSSSKLVEVQQLIEEHDVHGYMEIPEIRGSGERGKHMGTRVWPETCCLIFAVVEATKADELVVALEDLSQTCAPKEGLRVVILPAEKVI